MYAGGDAYNFMQKILNEGLKVARREQKESDANRILSNEFTSLTSEDKRILRLFFPAVLETLDPSSQGVLLTSPNELLARFQLISLLYSTYYSLFTAAVSIFATTGTLLGRLLCSLYLVFAECQHFQITSNF